MKRSDDPDTEIVSKKPRSTSPDFFQASPKRKVEELLQLGGDDNGHIQGKVFMIWPPRNRSHRINLEVVEDSRIYRFEVEVPHGEGISFRPHDHIHLALKGMHAERRKDSSSPHYFPIVLKYPAGVVLMYLSGVNAGKIVDTCVGNTHEWYEPGMVRTVSDAVGHDAYESHNNTVPEVPTHNGISSHEEGANQESIAKGRQPDEKPTRRSTKSRKRKRDIQKERNLALRNQAGDERPAEFLAPRDEQPGLSAAGSSKVSPTPLRSTSHQIGENSRGLSPVSASNANGSSRVNDTSGSFVVTEEHRVTFPGLQAGIRTQRGDVFHALNAIKKGAMVNVIGVVTSVSPKRKTRTNEWSRSFTIVDPSIAAAEHNSITVNCFQKKYVEWLPQVEKDAIVILRRLRVTEFNGRVAATGFHDKLRWAVYDASKHTIRPPAKGDVPEKEAIDDGMGYEFSPYWEPFQDSVELDYCRQVAEWWKALRELESHNVVTTDRNAPIPKQHLLISSASPDLPPGGYFNCTVQVLQKFDNPGGATVVYVTDYTSNPLLHPVQSTWCPPELSEYVLPCDMWDGAKALARLMIPGEYWYFHNVRAKWNPSRYMEGTMQLAEKVMQLDETKVEMNPPLAALLARKKEFGRDLSGSPIASGSPHIFPEVLLQDVEEGTNFISCTVELLHVDIHPRDGHFIYVTDYTYNPNLPGASTAEWARGLDHRIVKIKLHDVQTSNAVDDFKIGSMYTVYNLRLKHTNTSGGFQGRLGGEDRLIAPLHDLSSERAQTLLRNKGKWQSEITLDNPATLPSAPPNEPHPLDDNNVAQDACSELPENQVRILARVVDFFPFSLEDACILRCTKCDSSPPPSFKQCPRCDDMMESHCEWVYCFYVRLQDEAGTELAVSLSGKECTLLQGVQPADFRCDLVAFRKFLEKVGPILGNLRDTHLAWSKNEDQVIESPRMRFTLESWMIVDEQVYGLIGCVPA